MLRSETEHHVVAVETIVENIVVWVEPKGDALLTQEEVEAVILRGTTRELLNLERTDSPAG